MLSSTLSERVNEEFPYKAEKDSRGAFAGAMARVPETLFFFLKYFSNAC